MPTKNRQTRTTNNPLAAWYSSYGKDILIDSKSVSLLCMRTFGYAFECPYNFLVRYQSLRS